MPKNLDTKCKSISALHEKYIKGTSKEEIIQIKTMFVCNLTHVVKSELKLSGHKAYITSKCLKHLYDKRTAEFYDFLLENIVNVVEQPEQIYKNKDGKRGNLIFLKTIRGVKLIVSVEIDKKNKWARALFSN